MRPNPPSPVAESGLEQSNRALKKHWEEAWESEVYSLEDLVDGDPWVGVSHSAMLPAILEGVPAGGRILEAGCGRSQWVIFLRRKGYRAVGLDYATEALAATRRAYPDLPLVGGDLYRMGLRDGVFDAILSWGVVEHFEEGPVPVLREMRRKLADGGLLFITVPCKNPLYFSPLLLLLNLLRRSRLLRKLLRRPERETAFYQYEFTPRRFCAYLREAGYAVDRVIPISHEAGLVSPLNRHFRSGSRLLCKARSGKWQGLTRTGRVLCSAIKAVSPWVTPDQVFCVARKAGGGRG